MSDFSSTVVSIPELKAFHSIDRRVYTILVMSLYWEPLEAMHIIALWLWLERAGYRNLVKKILSLPSNLVGKLADEAIICLSCINSSNFDHLADSNCIPLMQSLMEKEISLKFLYENRLKATQGVTRIMDEVCTRALSDIMQEAIERNADQCLASSSQQTFQHSEVAPPPLPPPQMVVQLPPTQAQVPPEDRTMFVTFSKGYPVLEREVREFFTMAYGDFIESVYMQEVQPNEQALYARIVFRSASVIDAILNGQYKAKFTINGKHVWVRKFVPKRTKSSSVPYKP